MGDLTCQAWHSATYLLMFFLRPRHLFNLTPPRTRLPPPVNNMASLTTLEEDSLHLICQYLDDESLKSTSLAHRSLSQVYQHYCNSVLYISTSASADDQWETIEALNAFDRKDSLKFVHHLTINDTREPSDEGQELLLTMGNEVLPTLTGLETITWWVARNHTWKAGTLCPYDFNTLDLPPKVELSIRYYDDYTYPGEPDAYKDYVPGILSTSLETLLSGAARLDNLTKLEVESTLWRDTVPDQLKVVLLSCRRLRVLRLKTGTRTQYQPPQGQYRSWSPHEVAEFPPLRILDLECDAVFDQQSIRTWVSHGNWKKLETIRIEVSK